MNKRAIKVLDKILLFYNEKGRMPSNKELCFVTKLHRGVLGRYLIELKIEGKLKYVPQPIPYQLTAFK